MRYLTVLLATLTFTAGLYVVTARDHPEWLRALGIDCCGFADVQEREKVEQKREMRLDEALTESERSEPLRRAILADLRAGRLDLFAAAAAYQELNQLQPSLEKILVRENPQMSAGERACRQLLRWIEVEGYHTPALRELHARLAAQLQDHLRSHGEVILPEVPPGSHSFVDGGRPF
jgi:hypothetical protein